jgi:hypothetical protein
MGFSGAYVYSGGQWTSLERRQRSEFAEPWLMVDVHDSDFTTVTYSPAEPGTGVVYLGQAPNSPQATTSQADAERAAEGLARWWAGLHETDDEEFDAKRRQIAAYLARDPSSDQPKPGDGGERDPAEIFAELKTTRFLVALDLPVPEALIR